MKATKFISAFAVLVALASCSNDLSQPTAEDTPIRIQANVGGITTRAAHNLLSSFGNKDAINVYITENIPVGGKPSGASYNAMVYTHNGSSFEPQTTQYFPSNGNGIDVWAVYPSTVKEGNAEFTIEDNQTDNDNYKKSDLMFASKLTNQNKGNGNKINLSFTHQLSKIIVKLEKEEGVDGDLTDAEIKLTNVSMAATLNVSSSGINITSTTTTVNDELTIGNYIPDNGTAAIVIPQSTDDMKFKVELANGGTYTASMPSTTTEFAANTEYTFTLTLKANGITVSATIDEWTKKDGGLGDATLDEPLS